MCKLSGSKERHFAEDRTTTVYIILHCCWSPATYRIWNGILPTCYSYYLIVTTHCMAATSLTALQSISVKKMSDCTHGEREARASDQYGTEALPLVRGQTPWNWWHFKKVFLHSHGGMLHSWSSRKECVLIVLFPILPKKQSLRVCSLGRCIRQWI